MLRRLPVASRPRTRLLLEQLEARELLSGYAPTPAEQLFLEQLNDARANPAAYGASIGVDLSYVAPSQPLAFSPELIQAARLHSQDMNAAGYFSHVSPTAGDVGQRLMAAGVSWTSYGESIAAGQPYAQPGDALKGLIVDAGVADLGHRNQLLAIEPATKGQNQAGVGIVQGGSGAYTNYYTIDTASTNDDRPILTGVVFNDVNHNGKYDIGEGLGGVTVSVTGGPSVATWDTGGYSLPVSPGTYTVTASGGGLGSAVSQTVTVGSANVRLNFQPGNPSGGAGGSTGGGRSFGPQNDTPAPPPPGPGYFMVTAGHALEEYKDQLGWYHIGSAGTIESISSATDNAGHPVVFAVSMAHGFYRYDDWTGWQRLGADGTVQTVSAGTDLAGQANAFILGTDGSFLEFSSQRGWARLGAPGTVLGMGAAGGDRVYVIGADQSVLQHDPLTGWGRLTGPGFATTMSVATDSSGDTVLYVITPNHALYAHDDRLGWMALGASGTIQAVQAGTDPTGAAQALVTTRSGAEFLLSRSGWAALGNNVKSVLGSAPGLFYAVMPDDSIWRYDNHWGWLALSGSGFNQS